MPAPSHPTIAARLGRLDALGRDDLAAEWASAFGVPAPCKASREFLLKAMAHRAQVEATRDLRPAVRKALLQIARGLRDGNAVSEFPALAPSLKPGSLARPALSITVQHRLEHHRHAAQRTRVLRAARHRQGRRSYAAAA